MTWPEGSENPEGKASERNPDVVRSAHRNYFYGLLLSTSLAMNTRDCAGTGDSLRLVSDWGYGWRFQLGGVLIMCGICF